MDLMDYIASIPEYFAVLQVFYVLLFYRMERKHLKKLEGKKNHLSINLYFYLVLIALLTPVIPIFLLIFVSFFIHISSETPVLMGCMLFIFSSLHLLLWNYFLINKGYIGLYINKDQLYMIKYDFRLRLVDFKTIPVNNLIKCKLICLDISSKSGILEFSTNNEKLYLPQENSPIGKLKKVFKLCLLKRS